MASTTKKAFTDSNKSELHQIYHLASVQKDNSKIKELTVPRGIKIHYIIASVSRALSFGWNHTRALWKSLFIKHPASRQMCIEMYWWASAYLFYNNTLMANSRGGTTTMAEQFNHTTEYIGKRLSANFIKIRKGLEGQPIKISDEFLDALPDAISRVAYKMIQRSHKRSFANMVAKPLIQQVCNWMLGSKTNFVNWRAWREVRSVRYGVAAANTDGQIKLIHAGGGHDSDSSDDAEQYSEDELSAEEDHEINREDTCSTDPTNAASTVTAVLPIVRKREPRVRSRYTLEYTPLFERYVKAANIDTDDNELAVNLRLTESKEHKLNDNAGFQPAKCLKNRKHPRFPKVSRNELNATYDRLLRPGPKAATASYTPPGLMVKSQSESVLSKGSRSTHTRASVLQLMNQFDVTSPVVEARRQRILRGDKESKTDLGKKQSDDRGGGNSGTSAAVSALEHKLDSMVSLKLNSESLKSKRKAHRKY